MACYLTPCGERRYVWHPRCAERRTMADDPANLVIPPEIPDVALDGGLRLRGIRPDDESRLVALHDRLSQHTAYQRFFTAMKRLPTNWAHFLANVDYQTRLALVI